MDIEAGLTTHLMAQAGLTALIDRRFSFELAQEGTKLPYVTCKDVSNVLIHSHDGQNVSQAPMYQFTVYASTRASSVLVGTQLKEALSDHTGETGGVTVQYITLENEIKSTYKNADGTILLATLDLEYQINFEKE